MAKESTSPAKPKKVPNHPKYEDMIHEAIVALKNRRGSSRQDIKKYIVNTYKLPDNNVTKNRFRLAVNKGVKNGLLFFPNGPSGTILVKKQIKEEKEEPNEYPISFQNGTSGNIKVVKIKKEKKESKKKKKLRYFQNVPGPSGTIKLVKEVQIKEEKEEPEKMGNSSSFQYGLSDTIKRMEDVKIKKEK